MAPKKFPTEGIKTFILPNQDKKATEFINNPDIVVTLRERHIMPRDGVIVLYLEYLDYGVAENEQEEIF